MFETYSKTIIDMKGRFKVRLQMDLGRPTNDVREKGRRGQNIQPPLFRIMSRTYSKAYLLLKEG